MAVTIIDVAKKAGVSISTVSKFLNGGKVRETNRIRIGDAIRESVTTDAGAVEICQKYFISQSTLERMVRKYYVAFANEL